MTRKVMACAIIMAGFCANCSLQAAAPQEQSIYIKPSFEFRCFIDKFVDNFSLPGLLTIATASLSVYYLKKAISAYADRHVTINYAPSVDVTMLRKAKDYGIAAASLALVTAALYFRAPINDGLAHLLQLIRP